MSEENENLGNESEDDVFDYNDLINDFTRDDEAEEKGKSLDNVDVSELIDKSEAESESRKPEKTPEENIADIFDELDEKARSSIFEDTDEEGEIADETSAAGTNGDAGEDEQYTLEKSIDDDEGDYASILSQLEGGSEDDEGSSGDLNVPSDAAAAEGQIVSDAGGSEDDFSFDNLFDASGEEEAGTGEEKVATDEGTVEEILSVSDSADIDLPEDISGAENETAPETGEDQSFEDILGVGEFAAEEPAEVDGAATGEETPPVSETVGERVEETAAVTDAASGEPVEVTAESGGDDDMGSRDDILGFGGADGGGDVEAAGETVPAEEDAEDAGIAESPAEEAYTAESPDEEVGDTVPVAGETEETAVTLDEDVSYTDVLGGLGSDDDDTGDEQVSGDMTAADESGEDSYSSALSDFESPAADITAEVPQLDFESDEKPEPASASYEDALSGYSDDAIEITGETEAVEITGEVEAVGDEAQVEAEEASSFESTFDEDDSFFGSDEEEDVTAGESESGEKKGDEEDDFLGIGQITTDKTGGAAAAEVLFEGIEMDYDEQISAVTLAEVLLAQGKNDEAEELFKKVQAQKGITTWVAKRLNLNAPVTPDVEAAVTDALTDNVE